ncbi:hypothetical protein PHJA_001489000 [Phtheirospermum japonicum]|uniref:Uncharacterized protein n=1 Tax=Phtheirospermum japonicum TaxID=374723 RepID=A0A830C2Z3_9LAMI|nr:hypothetical protein PHJA_001489000 [Phtheirospermum japonicum]
MNHDNEEFHYWRDNFTHHCYPLGDQIELWPEKPTRYRYIQYLIWKDNFTHHCYPLGDQIELWPEKPTRYRAAEAMKELMWQNGQIMLQLYTVLFGSGGEGGEGEQGTVTEVPATGAEQESVLVYPIDETTSFGCDSFVDLFDFAPTVTPPTSPPFAAFFETQSPLPQQPGEKDSAKFSSLTSLPRVDQVSAPPVAAAVEPTVVYVTPVAPTGPPSLHSFYQSVVGISAGVDTAAADGKFTAVSGSASSFSASQQRKTLAAGKAIVVDDSESEETVIEKKTEAGSGDKTDAGKMLNADSHSAYVDEYLKGITVGSEVDSLPDLQEQVVWLKVELCRLLEAKRSVMLRLII